MNEILKILADNPALMEAVRKVIEDEFETPAFNDEISNELLGQVVRAKMKGLEAVETAFSKIARLKTHEVKKEAPNPAR